MQRQESQKNQEMIVRFLNFCAILIQKNVKGYIQRQRHKIIMMHIRRFKAILNGFIQGYRTRQILKVPDVAKLRQNIIETDDGTYGNPQIRQKKIRLIRMIENYLQNGQFYKKLKRVKSSQKQFVPNQYLDNEFVSQDQKFQQNYYKKAQKQPLQQNQVEHQYYDQLIQNEYSEQPQQYYQEYMQQNSQIHDKSHSNSNLSGQYHQSQRFDNQQDERPIRSKNQTNFSIQDRTTPERNSYDGDRPICGKGKYTYEEDDRPINAKNNANIYNNYEDERPIASKKANNYYEDDRPIAAKNINAYNQYQDERPIKKGKDIYQQEQEQYVDNDRPIASTGKYQQFEDERPLGGKGQYDIPADELPISGKGTYGNFEDEEAPPKKQKPPPRKKNEQKKENKQIEERQQNIYDNQNENEPPLGKMQNEDFNDQEKPKPKKKDPKLLENLKKRTKYDPRKAIQEAKKKQEEQQQVEQIDVEDVVEQQEKEDLPQQQQQVPQKKQVLSQKNLQERQQSPKPNKLNLSATPEKQAPSVEQVGECSPKDDASDQKPKNFLKRKSKQIPLKNPKVDPKTVKSKVKNCWNAGNTMDDPEFDCNEDIPQSPKAYINNKSPSRRFEQKGSDQQLNYQQQQQQQLQQQQLIQQQQIQQNKSQGPLHVQVQLVQENLSQYQINPSHQANHLQQQKKQSIQLDELERAYYSKYTQKLETTKMNLKVLDQERQQNSRGVPIITTKSRFFTSFRVNDFERLLAQLEDQYNKLQISK
ncbi:unnamed protein product [Paramecium primaurelia]|uniref:Uncharacterized protein n=1 Tax=Paramecium primaurelia TaxID=5886 RepID=A0A8S1JR85_PARPR|nr:unnamed protein product [Paramecium primaurelia]